MIPELIEKLAPWSAPRQVLTKRGDRILRTAPVTEDLEKFYRNNRETLSQAGVVFSHYNGKHELNWWQELPGPTLVEKQERIAASRATDSEIDIPCPAGLSFRGYQRAGVEFALGCFKKSLGVLIADDMGLGKTPTAIGVLNADPKIHRVLIIVPNGLLLNWYRELKRFLARPMSVRIVESKESFPSEDIVLINYEKVSRFEGGCSYYWDLVILDEAHRLRNPKRIDAKAILGYRPNRKEAREGMQPTSGIPTKRKMALTGTPIENRPMDLFPILNWLDPLRWKSRSKFGVEFCGANIGNNWNCSGASNTDRLQTELRGSIMIRRRKYDPGITEELPPKQRQLIVLPSDGLEAMISNERALAERHEQKLAAIKAQAVNPADYNRLASSMEAAEGTNGKGVFKVSHEIALAKVPLIAEHALQALEDGEKLVIFALHLDVIEAYRKALEQYRPVVFTGAQGIVERQRAVDTFQRDESCRVFLGNEAAKEGLTLTAGSQAWFAELFWTPGIMRQMEDRLCRIGQKKSVLVLHFALQGSIDVNKIQALLEKEEIIEGALDRRSDGENKAAYVPRGTIQVPDRRPLIERLREQKVESNGQQLLLV